MSAPAFSPPSAAARAEADIAPPGGAAPSELAWNEPALQSAPAQVEGAATPARRGGAAARPSARVWRAFRAHGPARWSLRGVALLALLAISADWIANDKPYYMKLDGEWYLPIATAQAVQLGLRQWPEPLRGADFYELAKRADAALWPPIPYAASRPDLSKPFEPPGAEHWIGTDQLGRDIAAGMLHGTRISLTIGLVVVAIQASIGLLLGGLAGYYGGWVDLLISRLIEIMLGIPVFFLLLIVAAVFPPSIYLIMVVLGVTGWTGIARYARSEFLRCRSQEFVEAARSLGASDARIMLRHILPNAVTPVLVSMSFGVASAILAESGLSFLGIGVPAELVTWGSILSVARQNGFAWWLAVFPGAAIFLTVTAYNLIGDGLRDALDPRLTPVRRAPAAAGRAARGAAAAGRAVAAAGGWIGRLAGRGA
jgi:peptide/nickel transport system permease protein